MLLLSGNVPEESNQGEVSAKYSEGNIGETSEKTSEKYQSNFRDKEEKPLRSVN